MEMEYNHQLTENDRHFVEDFSEYVNGKMASSRNAGRALADDHRYLVNEKAKLMFFFMEQLAENWHRGKYDQRNECLPFGGGSHRPFGRKRSLPSVRNIS